MASGRWIACVVLMVSSLGIAGCSGASWLAAGPAMSFERRRAHALGAEALGRAVVGESNGKSFLGLEGVARVLVTGDRQLLGAGPGMAWFGSFGRGLVTLDGTPMLAFEHVPGSVLTVGTLRAGVGLGYAFEHSTATSTFGGPWMMPGFATEITKTTALTIELTGAVDAPVTRAPQFSAGILLGLAWLEQQHTVEAPPLPTPFLNPLDPWRLLRAPRAP
jgi:hypothetical protein